MGFLSGGEGREKQVEGRCDEGSLSRKILNIWIHRWYLNPWGWTCWGAIRVVLDQGATALEEQLIY